MKWSGRIGLVVLGLLAFGCGSSNGRAGGGPVTGVAGPTTVATTLVPPTTTTPIAGRPQDKGFTVLDLQLKQDNIVGVFAGTAEVQNNGKHTHTATMRFTFKQNGKVVGVADAIANTVAVGKTVAVDLASTDKWDGGPVTYEFQVSNLY